jgi:hypothetical protein
MGKISPSGAPRRGDRDDCQESDAEDHRRLAERQNLENQSRADEARKRPFPFAPAEYLYGGDHLNAQPLFSGAVTGVPKAWVPKPSARPGT